MDRRYFLQLDEHLKSEIEDGGKLGENDIFGPIMHQISFRSCLILGMRSVAYRNQLVEPHRDERTEYFDGIEEILRHQHGEVGHHDHHGIMVHEVVRRFLVELLQAQIYQQVKQQEVADDDGDPNQVISMVSVFFHTNL